MLNKINIMKKEKQFFVYIDRIKGTNEVFYVGEGNLYRSRLFRKRNNKWWAIFKVYSCDREIYCECADKYTALFIEEKLIEKYHTFVDDSLCNKHACNFLKSSREKYIERSIETNKKISNSLKGKKQSPEARAKNSLKNSGQNNAMSKTNRIKNSIIVKKRKPLSEQEILNRPKKAVYQKNLITNEIIAQFKSMTEASKTTNTNLNSICQCCRNNPNYSHAGGYKWEYVEAAKQEINN